MFYINQNIPCKKIETFQFTSSMEILTLEIILGKKRLIFGTYKTPKHKQWFFHKWATKIVLLGDLNLVRDNTQLQNFCKSVLFEHLNKKPTCYKMDTPTGIDHIITNIQKRFMKSTFLEIGITDHHKTIMTIFHSTFAKDKPKSFHNRCYKKFDLE